LKSKKILFVAHELLREVRINVVNTTVLEEAWNVYGEMMPIFQQLPGAFVRKDFEHSIDGFITRSVCMRLMFRLFCIK
jgi:hypothetical protein